MHFRIAALVLTSTTFSLAESPCPNNNTCVPNEDLRDMVTIMREHKCLKIEKPEFKLSPIVILTDREGRIYTSGAQPVPWTLQMKWCSKETVATGLVNVDVAKYIPPEYGFRLRPKAWIGYLPLEALDTKEAGHGIDAGVMLDFAHWKWINANLTAGVRSGGVGIGADITQNFGAYAGWSMTWGSWHQNVVGAFWFAF